MAETMKTIGVVGGGQMGSGIAQLGVVHGFQVWLLDQDPQALARSADYIAASIRRLVSKRALSQVPQSLLSSSIALLHCARVAPVLAPAASGSAPLSRTVA